VAQAGRAAGKKPVAQRHVLISSVKNEGPFLLEWVAHHLVLGFDRICVASNDCSDGSDRLLDALQAVGAIAHVPNPIVAGAIPQHAGYARIRAAYPMDPADWVMMLDADEFLNVHIGANRVQDLTARAGDADIIALSARCFSDHPQISWSPGPVTRAFVGALPARHWSNSAVKSLTRGTDRFRAFHNHHPVGFRGAGVPRVMRGDGVAFDLTPGVPLWKELRLFPPEWIAHDLAQYNHYPIKTWDSFQLRQARGRGAVAQRTSENERHTEEYFRRRSGHAGQEPSILRYGAATDRMMVDLLRDRVVRAAHFACEAAHAAACAPFRRV
jgi:hypothetical protein